MEKLTPEEEWLLGGLALACHEELVKGIPPKVVVGRCNWCKKFRPETVSCEVYPRWIPSKEFEEGCPDFESKETTEDKGQEA